MVTGYNHGFKAKDRTFCAHAYIRFNSVYRVFLGEDFQWKLILVETMLALWLGYSGRKGRKTREPRKRNARVLVARKFSESRGLAQWYRVNPRPNFLQHSARLVFRTRERCTFLVAFFHSYSARIIDRSHPGELRSGIVKNRSRPGNAIASFFFPLSLSLLFLSLSDLIRSHAPCNQTLGNFSGKLIKFSNGGRGTSTIQ